MKAIVFVLRGCSAAWIGAYGNEWIATPNLDRIAAEGIVFDQHFSDCPSLRGACRAWMSGLKNRQTQGHGLIESLRRAGVHTVLVRANHPDTDAPESFYVGWGEVFDVRPQQEDLLPLDSLARALPSLLDRLENIPNYLLWFDLDNLLPPWEIRQNVFQAYIEDTEEETMHEKAMREQLERDEEDDLEPSDEEQREISDNEAEYESEDPELEEHVENNESASEELVVKEEIEAEPVTPWFNPPTGPFDVSDGDAREWLHYSLGALVTGFDAELGEILEFLRSRGLDQTATWLLTSDFGFPLGEHGQIGQFRPWLYEEMVHLPLMIRLPRAEQACRRVSALTQPPDIFLTLLDLFGVDIGGKSESGMTLLPFTRGEGIPERDSVITQLDLGAASELAIRTRTWSYLLPTKVPEGEKREPQLFSKLDDRWEVNDMRARSSAEADELEEKLRSIKAPHD